MQSEIWKKTEQIFNEVVFLPEEEQVNFVEEKAGGDPEVREIVFRLLENDKRQNVFLDEPIFTTGTKILASAEDEELTRQKEFAHYRLLQILGRGGMGVVFLARDERLQRQVALKLLPHDFVENATLRSYFESEARIAAAISHPNIAHIYEAGEIEGQPFIAMEYVEGKTLREHLRDGKKTPIEALKVASQIASALAAAHKAGIIHRDIKPENIILHPDGYVKVLDFGISKFGGGALDIENSPVSNGNEKPTEHGFILGTIPYMSPEQLHGETADERSDIWSLGVVLYEMLMGVQAFEAESKNERIAAILKKAPSEFARLNFSPALLKILQRSLSKQKVDRYQTAAEMYADLQNVLENLEKRKASPTHASFFSEKKSLMAVALILAVATIMGTVYFLFQNKRVEKSAINQPELNFTHFTDEGLVLCSALSPNAKQIAYAREKDGQQSIRLREIETGEIREIVSPAPGNDFEGVCLTFSPSGDSIYYGIYENDSLSGKLYRISISGGEPQFLLQKIDSPVSFSPDGRQMVFLVAERNQEMLVVANADGSQPQIIVERSDPLFLSGDCYPAWSPDGQTIAFAEGTSSGQRQMHAALYNIATKKIQNLITQPFYDVRQLAWLKDGTALIVTARREGETNSQLYQIANPSGETTRLVEDLFNYSGISFSGDRSRFVSVAGEDVAQIWILDIENQDSAKQVSNGRHDGQGMAWLSNDSLVFGSNAGGSWDLWKMGADGSNRRQLTNDRAFDTDPSAASDGSFVVFSSTRSGIYHLWKFNLADSSLTQLTNGTGEYYPQITPDNRWAVFHRIGVGEPIAVWKVPIEGGSPIQLSAAPSSRADVSPDGRLVASTYRENNESDPSIGIYSIDGSKDVKRIKPLAGARIFSVPLRWSPDGKSIVYVAGQGGADNLWSQLLEGKVPPRQITNFTSDRIYSFDFAPDGKRVALARGGRTSHTVLIEGLE